MPKHTSRRFQASKSTATLFGVFNPEGFRVHTCKSRNDAQRVADRFRQADGVAHSVQALTRYNVREGF